MSDEGSGELVLLIAHHHLHTSYSKLYFSHFVNCISTSYSKLYFSDFVNCISTSYSKLYFSHFVNCISRELPSLTPLHTSY